jgi:hypothetical protein
MSRFVKNEDTELGRDIYIQNALKRIAEQAKTHNEL